MKFGLNEIIRSLCLTRPIFHSEDDLKFSLAWEIKNDYRKSEIFLEKRTKNNKGKRGKYIDMLIIDEEGHRIGIELKYFTAILNCRYVKEEYSLTTHSAQDI
jgi:hypothetical protein